MSLNLELLNGIKFDSFNLFIEWSIGREDFLKKMNSLICSISVNDKLNYCGYTVKSKLFGSIVEFRVVINFVNDKITSINVCDDRIEKDPIEKYRATQSFLESQFDKPSKHHKKGNEIENIWKFKNIKITHSLFDCFGSQEKLEICI